MWLARSRRILCESNRRDPGSFHEILHIQSVPHNCEICEIEIISLSQRGVALFLPFPRLRPQPGGAEEEERGETLCGNLFGRHLRNPSPKHMLLLSTSPGRVMRGRRSLFCSFSWDTKQLIFSSRFHSHKEACARPVEEEGASFIASCASPRKFSFSSDPHKWGQCLALCR